MSKFLRNLVEVFKDEDTSIAEDGAGSAEFTGSIDSGSYSLNAALSGSIFGGVPNNKITAFAGESATGWMVIQMLVSSIMILKLLLLVT